MKKVARRDGPYNADGEVGRLILEYVRATPAVLMALATLLIALTGLLAVLLR